MKKVLLIVGGIILVIIVIAAVSGGGKKSTSTQNNNQSTTANTAESTPSPFPMKITARELADDFDSNQVAAEAKWKDKLVEFSAQISNITDTGISFTNVGSKEFSLTQISCKVEDKQKLLPLKNGQTVRVQGVVGTQTIGVIEVKTCQVVS